jgi:hypothetical protein
VFPGTLVSPAGQARLAGFFHRLLLYQLPLESLETGNSAPSGEAWEGHPVSFYRDEGELRSVLASYRRLADQYPDPGDLDWLKVRGSDDVEQSGTGLRSALRGQTPAPGDPRKEAQVSLHLAQDMDRRQWEIDRIMAEVGRKESALGELLGVEDDAEAAEVVPHSPAMDRDVPAGPLPRRLEAWAFFHQAFGGDRDVLVADDPEFLAVMDMNLSRRLGGTLDPSRTTDVLEPLFTLVRPRADEGTPSLADAWEELSRFIEETASRSWFPNEFDGLRTRAAGITARLSGPAGSGALELTACLLPGNTLKEAFLAAARFPGIQPVQEPFCGPVLAVRERP